VITGLHGISTGELDIEGLSSFTESSDELMLYQLLIPQKTTFLGDSSDDFHLAFSPIHEQHITNHS
jgi:hypothetical protein